MGNNVPAYVAPDARDSSDDIADPVIPELLLTVLENGALQLPQSVRDK